VLAIDQPGKKGDDDEETNSDWKKSSDRYFDNYPGLFLVPYSFAVPVSLPEAEGNLTRVVNALANTSQPAANNPADANAISLAAGALSAATNDPETIVPPPPAIDLSATQIPVGHPYSYSSTVQTKFGARILVPNTDDNTVSIIDATTYTTIATLPVPKARYSNPIGTLMYVLDSGRDEVYVVDMEKAKILGSPIKMGSFGTYFSATLGDKLYVETKTYTNQVLTSTVSVIQGDRIVAKFLTRSPVGHLTAVGTDIYASNSFGVDIIDTLTNTITPVSLNGSGNLITVLGKYLFVTVPGDQALAVLDITKPPAHRLIGKIQLPNSETPVYPISVGTKLYLTGAASGQSTSNHVYEIDIQNPITDTAGNLKPFDQLARKITIPLDNPLARPYLITETSVGNKVYVADVFGEYVYVIDALTGSYLKK